MTRNTINSVRKFGLSLAVLMTTATGTLFSSSAEAVPAFARQTGFTCNTCHFDSFPSLNAFGRSFRTSGYTMRGAMNLIEGENVSLPSNLPISLVTKLRWNNGGDNGSFEWPDEAALLVGGRGAENWGYLGEIGLWGIAEEAPGESTALLSFKVHFNVTDNFAIVPYQTDGLGTAYGMELMNTGMARSQRPTEDRTAISAFHRTGLGGGAASGMAFVYHTDSLMVNYSHVAPAFGHSEINILGGLAHWLRVNYFMDVAGWDTGVGVAMASGSAAEGATADHYMMGGLGVDVQMQGSLAGRPAGFYFTYSSVAKDANLAAAPASNIDCTDCSSMGLFGKVGVMEKLGVLAGMTTATEAGADAGTRSVIGVEYQVSQNGKFEIYNHSDSKNSNAGYTQIQWFAGY